MKSTKPCIRSPLECLGLHQKQAVMGWLTTGGPGGGGVSHREAQRRLAREFGVKTSQRSLSRFFHRNRREAPLPTVETRAFAEAITIVITLPKNK